MNLTLTNEPIYSYDLDITGVTDYGVQMPDILGGKTPIPPQGARFDVAFAGRATGRLSGAVRGVDYLVMRADSRIDLDIRATIETVDGCRIHPAWRDAFCLRGACARPPFHQAESTHHEDVKRGRAAVWAYWISR
jgi:hypothetical protein